MHKIHWPHIHFHIRNLYLTPFMLLQHKQHHHYLCYHFFFTFTNFMHAFFSNDGLVVFKGKKKASEIKDCLKEFQQTVNTAAGEKHLQFTAAICTNKANSPTPAKEDRFQIVMNDEFPFLNTSNYRFPSGDQLIFMSRNGNSSFITIWTRSSFTWVEGFTSFIHISALNCRCWFPAAVFLVCWNSSSQSLI